MFGFAGGACCGGACCGGVLVVHDVHGNRNTVETNLAPSSFIRHSASPPWGDRYMPEDMCIPLPPFLQPRVLLALRGQLPPCWIQRVADLSRHNVYDGSTFL
jgi:hypothetical protein